MQFIFPALPEKLESWLQNNYLNTFLIDLNAYSDLFILAIAATQQPVIFEHPKGSRDMLPLLKNEKSV